MKSKIIALFLIFFIPIIYFYNEPVATLSLALVSSAFAIYYSIDFNKHKFIPTKLLNTVSILIFVWFMVIGRSVCCSCSTYSSWSAFVKLCSLILMMFSLSIELSNQEHEKSLFFYKISAFTGFLQGIMAICEYIEAPQIPPTWLDPASKELFRTRCCGIMTDPNIFSAFLSAIFLMTIGLILKSENKKEQTLAAISLLCSGTGIFMTLSRGGWVALAVALAVFIVFLFIGKIKPDNYQIKTLAVTAIILITIFFSGPFKYRLFSITRPTDMTFSQRTLINKGIFKSMNKLPIIGHGLHSFTQVYPLYRIVGGDYPMNAHNEILHSLIETGFLSSVLLVFITIYLIKLAYIEAKKANLDSIVFSSVFASLFVQNLSGFSSRVLPTSVLIVLSVGAMLSSQLKNTKTNYCCHKFSQISIAKMGIIILSLFVLVCGTKNYISLMKLESANNLVATGNIAKASEAFKAILEKQPDNTSAANSLGMILLLAKQPEQAISTWKKAMEYNKLEAIFPINIARAYTDTDRLLAESYYQYALQLDPASENYRVEYAQYLIKNGKKTEAKKILEEGLTYSPGFHNVYKGFLQIEQLLKELSAN